MTYIYIDSEEMREKYAPIKDTDEFYSMSGKWTTVGTDKHGEFYKSFIYRRRVEQEYRMLEVGEVIQEGDEVLRNGNYHWEKVSIAIGEKVIMVGTFRRPVSKPVEQPQSPWCKYDPNDETEVSRLVDAFLAWRLPDSVCSDPCALIRGYPNRSGTNLLTATEAHEMVKHLLTPPAPPLSEDDEAFEKCCKDKPVLAENLQLAKVCFLAGRKSKEQKGE